MTGTDRIDAVCASIDAALLENESVMEPLPRSWRDGKGDPRTVLPYWDAIAAAIDHPTDNYR